MADRIKGLRGGLTQAEFASRIGISSKTVIRKLRIPLLATTKIKTKKKHFCKLSLVWIIAK